MLCAPGRADGQEVNADTIRKHNTISIVASSGPVFLSMDDKKYRTELAVANQPLIYCLDISYNFKRNAGDVYFALGLFSGVTKFRLQELYIQGTLQENIGIYSAYFFAGIPVSGNFDFKVSNKLTLHNRIAAIPILELGHFARRHNVNVSAQLSSMLKYGPYFLGLQIYRPLGVYNPGTFQFPMYRLTSFMLCLGVEFGKS
jgi:hypothetical protein